MLWRQSLSALYCSVVACDDAVEITRLGLVDTGFQQARIERKALFGVTLIEVVATSDPEARLAKRHLRELLVGIGMEDHDFR